MSRKPLQRPNKLEKIVQASNTQSEINQSSITQRKRVSINQLMHAIQRPEKMVEKVSNVSELPSQQQKFEEKDRMIKALQEEIINKKLKNDMIQDAFQRRQEAEEQRVNAKWIEQLAQGCKILASQNKSFKKVLLRSLTNLFKCSGKSKAKSVKALLIWLISWVTHLFTFLSSTLIKKS